MNIATEAVSLDDVLTMDVVVHFIDVGVGDAILIDLPQSDNEIIIDGGDRRKGFNFLEYAVPFLDGPVELAVITHADYDHWSGIQRLIASGRMVKELWDPGYGRDCKFTGVNREKKKKGDQYLKFIKKLPKPGMKLIRPVKIDPVKPLKSIQDVEFTVLHADDTPPGRECSYIVNNASVVISMKYKDVTFLFTGDANGKERDERGSVEPSHVEARLLALEKTHPGILRADVLKVPHHGSETANTDDFIRAVQPRFAVISSTSTPHYVLPKKRITQRYQRIRFNRNKKIEKVLRTNIGEPTYEKHKYGDDHIICGTNGRKDDVICDYIWRFKE
jgi:beta-lactamase superfamily II metal-dependent hydrolase